MDIKDIKVYDPKQDGLDKKTFNSVYWAAHSINKEAAYAMFEGLRERVENSLVYKDANLTLDDFLYGRGMFNIPGYSVKNPFVNNPKIVAVVFMDGEYHSEFTQEAYDSTDLERLGDDTNSIPFMFFNLMKVYGYTQKQKAMKIATGDKFNL